MEPPTSIRTYCVDKRHVHKENEGNIFIKDVSVVDVSDTYPHTFASNLLLQKSHPFFFERKRVHVPGLYLVEAGRQMGVAVAHLYYGVPFEYEFILDSLDIKFKNFANLRDPITAIGTMSDIRLRRGAFHSSLFGGTIEQGNSVLMELSGRLTVLNSNMMRRIERTCFRKMEVAS